MAKTLDFNVVERPVLELIMTDDARTHIKVSTPTESLVEELQNMAPKLNAMLNTPDQASTEDVYDLAARLMNCNRSFITVTKEDLRDKYRMNLESLLIFFSAYLDFINELTNAKN